MQPALTYCWSIHRSIYSASSLGGSHWTIHLSPITLMNRFLVGRYRWQYLYQETWLGISTQFNHSFLDGFFVSVQRLPTLRTLRLTYWQPLEITTTVFLHQHYLTEYLVHRLSYFTVFRLRVFQLPCFRYHYQRFGLWLLHPHFITVTLECLSL